MTLPTDDAKVALRKRTVKRTADKYIPEFHGRGEKPETTGTLEILEPVKGRKREAVTLAEYDGWQQAFDHFNIELYGGKLINVLIVYARRSHSAGHYAHERYSGRDTGGRIDEISLNPDGFVDRTDERILSTLVHEMTHHEQQYFGNAPKRAYHNKQWAARMKSLGLYPSNTGAVGGRETGVQMSHSSMAGRSMNRIAACARRAFGSTGSRRRSATKPQLRRAS
jgi:hypothetical protein